MSKCQTCGAIAVGAVPNCGHNDPTPKQPDWLEEVTTALQDANVSRAYPDSTAFLEAKVAITQKLAAEKVKLLDAVDVLIQSEWKDIFSKADSSHQAVAQAKANYKSQLYNEIARLRG